MKNPIFYTNQYKDLEEKVKVLLNSSASELDILNKYVNSGLQNLITKGETMIIVKIGGSEGINYDFIVDDIASLVKEGRKWI